MSFPSWTPWVRIPSHVYSSNRGSTYKKRGVCYVHDLLDAATETNKWNRIFRLR